MGKKKENLAEDQGKVLEDIRNLFVLQLLTNKVKSASIYSLLKMDQADFSRKFPMRKILGTKTAQKKKAK